MNRGVRPVKFSTTEGSKKIYRAEQEVANEKTIFASPFQPTWNNICEIIKIILHNDKSIVTLYTITIIKVTKVII